MEYCKLLSISQESTWGDCEWRYKLERVDRLPWVRPIYMVFGSACHKAVEMANRAKRSGTELPMDFLMYWWAQEFKPYTGRIWEYRARKLLGIYLDQVLPLLDPLYIEEQFYLDLMPGYKVTGVVDLYTADEILVDFKFSSKVRSRKGSLQEPCYKLGIESMGGFGVREYWRLNFLTRPNDQGQFRIVREVCTIEQKHIDAYHERMIQFARRLKANAFRKVPVYRKNPTARYCHPRFCPYYDNPCDHTV